MRGYPQWQHFADKPARLWWNRHLQHSEVLQNAVNTLPSVALAHHRSADPITLIEDLGDEVKAHRATDKLREVLATVPSTIVIPNHLNDKGAYNGNQ